MKGRASLPRRLEGVRTEGGSLAVGGEGEEAEQGEEEKKSRGREVELLHLEAEGLEREVGLPDRRAERRRLPVAIHDVSCRRLSD
jgi:hypothetical protein